MTVSVAHVKFVETVIDRWIDRQTDKQMNRQTDIHTDRQTDRGGKIDRYSNILFLKSGYLCDVLIKSYLYLKNFELQRYDQSNEYLMLRQVYFLF